MKARYLFLALIVVCPNNDVLLADFVNGEAFGPIHSNVNHLTIVNGDYYQNEFQVEGGYEWTTNANSSFATGVPEFNYDRSVTSIVFDFSGTRGFNPNGAMLNMILNWDNNDLKSDNFQDRLYVHGYDVLNLPNGTSPKLYFFEPPESHFVFHQGVVDGQMGYQSITYPGDPNDPNNPPPPTFDLSIDVDLTDLFDPVTQTVQLQIEYVDPDLEANLGAAGISQFRIVWNPVPEPTNCLLAAMSFLLAYTRRHRI